MTPADPAARLTALAIGLGALIGMLPPLGNAMDNGGGLLAGIWSLLRFFTIWTNLLIGIAFVTIAVRGRDAIAPALLGGLVLAIMLVGAVYNLLLGQIAQPSWWMRIGDSLHHHVAPIAVPLWWFVFARHGSLSWRAPLLWALYPLGYSAYILVRAALEPAGLPQRYPYFFLDVETLGWGTALLHMGAIAMGFVVAGFVLVALDHRLGRRRAG